MLFKLTRQLVLQAREYNLKSACGECYFYNEAEARCRHGWPDRGQAQDLTALDPDALEGENAEFCREFELK